MSSETHFSLPVINFSEQELKLGSPEWDSAKVRVQEALEEYGCFEASFVLEVRKAVFRALEEVSDLPLQTKQLYVSAKPSHGYIRVASGPHENIVIDAGNIETGLTTTLWPQGNTSFSETLVSFTELASTLEKRVRRMILEISGVEKYADELIESTNYILKAMKYEGSQTSVPFLGAHVDQSMVTLLYQDEDNGLEIQKRDGEWINVNPSPNSFIVLVGESLNVFLNGGLSSTFHRVIMNNNTTRYSFGLFAIQRGGYQVKVPKECVNDKDGLLFKPFDYDEFWEIFCTQLTQGNFGYSLKNYCSV